MQCCIKVRVIGLGLGLDLVYGGKLLCTRISATFGCNCHGPATYSRLYRLVDLSSTATAAVTASRAFTMMEMMHYTKRPRFSFLGSRDAQSHATPFARRYAVHSRASGSQSASAPPSGRLAHSTKSADFVGECAGLVQKPPASLI